MKTKSSILLLVCGICAVVSLTLLVFVSRQTAGMKEKAALYEEEQQVIERISQQQIRLAELEAQKASVMSDQAVFEQEISALRDRQEFLRPLLEADRSLYDLEIGKFTDNYDVDMFQKVQRQSSQTGTIGKFVFGGGLFVQAFQSNEQYNMDQAYQNRVRFGEALRDLTDSSKKLALEAKADYDSAYGFWLSLLDLQTGEEILANGKLLEQAGQTAAWEDERARLVSALEKYAFDLSILVTAYGTVLSTCEENFLSELTSQLTLTEAVIDHYDPQWSMGYTQDEKKERYLTFLESYRNTIDTMATFNAYDEGLNSAGEITAYHECYFRPYKNKGNLVYLKSSPSHTFTGFVGKRFYDQYGNPLYLSLNQGNVAILDGEIVDFTCESQEKAEALVLEARRIWQEYETEEFSRGYHSYAVH